MAYNGWTNHATWNAFNWISSDYGAQKSLEYAAEFATLEDMVILVEMAHGTIQRNDLDPGEVDEINWTEIAEAYME